MEKERSALFQSDFYRIQYRMTLRLFFLLSCLSFALVCAIGWLVIFKKMPQTYYAAVTDGQVLLMKAGQK